MRQFLVQLALGDEWRRVFLGEKRVGLGIFVAFFHLIGERCFTPPSTPSPPLLSLCGMDGRIFSSRSPAPRSCSPPHFLKSFNRTFSWRIPPLSCNEPSRYANTNAALLTTMITSVAINGMAAMLMLPSLLAVIVSGWMNIVIFWNRLAVRRREAAMKSLEDGKRAALSAFGVP